ncbi:unnamed protein product [Taenia asiatica]|uniref:Zgc: n=1 Tax=Taenia asiatica TaxID=60517 RepID=A0A0R3VXI3_TAEAS|nr:unnamed protein product [Taenia asiatica]
MADPKATTKDARSLVRFQSDSPISLSEKQELSSSMVRSAIESIEQELRDHRGHHRSHEGAQTERKHRRTVSESTGPSGSPVTKRPCLRKSDGHLPLDELDLLERHSTSPSLSTTTDEDDVNYGDVKKKDGKEKEMTDVEMVRLPLSPTDVEDNPDSVAVISDSDEEGLDSTIAEDDDEDDDDDIDTDDEDEEGKGVEEQESREEIKRDGELKSSMSAATETDLQEEMRQYLPPPCPLEYAENPLLHMSPQVGFHIRALILQPWPISSRVKIKGRFFCS